MTANLAKTLLRSCIRGYNTRKLQIRPASTFKAALLKEAGKPLVIEERKVSKLNKTDVRIKVHYCSINSADCRSFHDGSKEYPYIPGYELSGEVLEVGKKVTKEQFLEGERVAALSFKNLGGFAEQCVVDVNDCFKIPTNVESKDAAAIIVDHSTAIYTFSELHTLQEGEVVVVSASGTGLGLAAIDVAASMYKSKVIAVIDHEDISELVRQCGAFNTVAYGPKFVKEISGLTDKKGASVVYDAVGDFMIEHIASCVAPSGHIFHAAPITYTTVQVPPSNTSLVMVSLRALREQNFDLYRSTISDTLDLAHEGIIGSHIGANYKLVDVNKAVEVIESKKCAGKVVIEML